MSPTMTLDENDAPPKPRENALKHGLSGAGVVLPEPMRLQVDRRRLAYARIFPPVDQLDVDDIDAAALGWVRFQESRSEMTHRAAIRSEMAVGKWSLLRLIDAQERAKRLGHNPPSVVSNLKTSFGGVRWLLDQWRMLKDALNSSKEGVWTLKQQERANNLAGVDRLFRDSDPHKIRDGSTEDRKKLLEGQVAELMDILADGELERLDGIERLATIHADHSLNDPSHDRLRLYEQRAFRMYERAIGRLKERHPEWSIPRDGGREAAEAFGAEIDRMIAEEPEVPGKRGQVPFPAEEMVPDPFSPEPDPRPQAPLLSAEVEDIKTAFVARILSAEVQSRVTDAEMRLLDNAARNEFRPWHARFAPDVDLATAIRGLIGYTRIQAEQGNYEDPNADFFAKAQQRVDEARADRDRREADRDKERRKRKAIKAARKRSRTR